MDEPCNKKAEIKKEISRGGVRRLVSVIMSELKDSRKEWENRIL